MCDKNLIEKINYFIVIVILIIIAFFTGVDVGIYRESTREFRSKYGPLI